MTLQVVEEVGFEEVGVEKVGVEDPIILDYTMVEPLRMCGSSEVRQSWDHRIRDNYYTNLAQWPADLHLLRHHLHAIPSYLASAVYELQRYQALQEVRVHLADFILQQRALSLRVLHYFGSSPHFKRFVVGPRYLLFVQQQLDLATADLSHSTGADVGISIIVTEDGR